MASSSAFLVFNYLWLGRVSYPKEENRVETCRLCLVRSRFTTRCFNERQVFFRLFRRCRRSSNRVGSVLSGRVSFIAGPVPNLGIRRCVRRRLRQGGSFVVRGDTCCVRVDGEDETGLRMFRQDLILRTTNDCRTRAMFFRMLQGDRSSFLTISLGRGHCK